MHLLHLAFAVSLLMPAAHAADTAEKALLRHSDGFSIDDDPRSPAFLAAYWQAQTNAALGVLNGHPGTPAVALVKMVLRDPKDPTIRATALGPDLIELDLSEGEIGDVLLLTRRGGRFGVAWDAAKLAPRDVQRFPMLAAWSVERAQWSRRVKAPQGQWDRYGPIHGSFRILPPDRMGHPRLALDATYAQAAGETVSGQLSLWSWDGTDATPLLAHTYAYMIDQPRGVLLDGDVLRVGEKADFKSFSACGACAGRQIDHAYRIGPDGVADLGKRSRIPEVDALDNLIDAMWRRAPTRDLASGQVVALLKPGVDSARDDARQDADHAFSFGTVTTSDVSRRRESRVLCFSTDDMEKPLLFTLTTRNGRVFLARAAVAAGADCPK